MNNQRPEPKIVRPEDIDPRHDWNRPLMALGQRQQARDPRRLLEHWRRRIKSDPGRARKARHAICRRVSQRNGACVRAGKLSSVASGPKAAYDRVEDLIRVFAPRGVFYVGDGELARVCKIAHNVMLGVVIENLIEITLLAQKAGVPRHVFLEFMNNSVMGSIFTQYKTPALVATGQRLLRRPCC